MTKIMMVINRGEGGLIGGAEKHVLDLCQHLPNKGYTVIITSNHEKLEKYAKSDSTRNSALIFETLPRSGSWLVPLSRLISKYQPDIIHDPPRITWPLARPTAAKKTQCMDQPRDRQHAH